jgi:intracellular septation protein
VNSRDQQALGCAECRGAGGRSVASDDVRVALKMDSKTSKADNTPPMKFLFDIFPVVLFFIAFKFSGIYVATAVAIAASFVQIAWVWLRHRKVETMLWVSLGVIVVFGGATLLLKDETFIKWKPTVLYWLFSVTLVVAAVAFKKNLIRTMMEKQVTLPDLVWSKLLASWIAFFAVMGALNLFVAFNYSTDAWVNFKLFGGIGLMLAFVVLQALMLSRYIEDKKAE